MGRYSLELNAGIQAEISFTDVAKKKGYEVIHANKDANVYKHVDLYLTQNHSVTSVDVKARKKLSRRDDKYNDDFTWIEFKNVRGNDGWLCGKADKIVFEREKDFVLVNRDMLQRFCEQKVSEVFVSTSKEALYKKYQRPNREDVITLIKLDDVLHELYTTNDVDIWKKVVV